MIIVLCPCIEATDFKFKSSSWKIKYTQTRIQTSILCIIAPGPKTMADPSSLWAQPDMLQTFSITVMPSGHLANEDLQSFDYVLFTSEPAEESASDLTVFVTKRLDLQVQPLFYVSIAGKALGLVLDRIISRFLGRLLSSSNRPLTSQMPLLGSSPSSVTSQHPGQHRQLGQH